MKLNLILGFLLGLVVSIASFSYAGSEKIQKSTDEMLLSAANVEFVQYVKGQDKEVKIFSTFGGDPAMNGNYLNLAVFADMDIGWNVFELANVSSFKLLPSAKKGFLKISLVRDGMNEKGDIIKNKSTLFINLEKSEEGSIEVEEK